jgi:hypothetical protein
MKFGYTVLIYLLTGWTTTPKGKNQDTITLVGGNQTNGACGIEKEMPCEDSLQDPFPENVGHREVSWRAKASSKPRFLKDSLHWRAKASSKPRFLKDSLHWRAKASSKPRFLKDSCRDPPPKIKKPVPSKMQ